MISKTKGLDELVAEVSKEHLLDAVLDSNNLIRACSRLNISKYEFSKLIQYYQINEFKSRLEARKKEIINRYFDIVDVLGRNPSSAEMQSKRGWHNTYYQIKKLWGNMDNFRLEFGIERPARKLVLSRNTNIKEEIINYQNALKEGNSIALTIYMKEVFSQKRLSIIKQHILLNKIKNGDQKARIKLIKGGLLNIIRIAQNCHTGNISLDDLIQEGNMGLIESIDKFFGKKHKNFRGYSSLWAYQKINRYLMAFSQLFNIPVHIGEKIFVLSKYMKDNLISEIDNKNIDQISSNTGLSLESIKTVLNIPKRIPLKEFTKLEINITGSIDNNFEICEQNNLKENIYVLLQTLDQRERDILVLRFGLSGEEGLTLEEIGAIYHVTRERIRQIESKALRKLKHPSRRKKIIDFY